jgi:hypothetical protein
MKSIPRRIRGVLPVRVAGNRAALLQDDGDSISIGSGSASVLGGRNIPGSRMGSIGRFINRHKRSLAITGGVVGGTALVGGIVGGIIAAKRRKTMQSNAPESTGMLGQLSSGPAAVGGGGGGGGGGRGGGFSRYNRIQGAVGRTTKRRGGKKRSKKRSKKHTKKAKKAKKGVRRGRITKRKGKKAVRSINKGKKKCKKGKGKCAF